MNLTDSSKQAETHPVLLLSDSPETQQQVCEALTNSTVEVCVETKPELYVERAAEMAVPVILVDTKSIRTEWQYMVRQLGKCGTCPSVIALLPSANPTEWAEALCNGFFDAVPAPIDTGELKACMLRAHVRWVRNQQVRLAQTENPLTKFGLEES